MVAVPVAGVERDDDVGTDLFHEAGDRRLDGGGVRATLDTVEAQALERTNVLRSMTDASRSGPYEFSRRLPINTLALRFQLDHETLQAQWAREQIATWRSPTDPADWNWEAALD